MWKEFTPFLKEFCFGTYLTKCWKFSSFKMKLPLSTWSHHCLKSIQIGSFCGLYFPLFRPNTGSYSVSLRIQSKHTKIKTRTNSVSGHFSRGAYEHICALKLDPLISNSIDLNLKIIRAGSEATDFTKLSIFTSRWSAFSFEHYSSFSTRFWFPVSPNREKNAPIYLNFKVNSSDSGF